jgi:hypothetical protein
MSQRKKPLIVIAVLLSTGFSYLTTGGSISAQGEMSPSQTIAFAEWQLLSPTGGRFSILMPIGEIRRDFTKDPKTPSFMVKSARELFLVGYYDLSPEQLENFGGKSGVLDEFVVDSYYKGFKLVSQRKFGLNGNPGIELNYLSEIPSAIKLVTRAVIVENRVYVLTVKSDSPERAKIFFDSFRPIF